MWLEHIVDSQPVPVIQHAALHDLALSLEPFIRFLPYTYTAQSSSASLSSLGALPAHGISVHSLSDTSKIRLAESVACIMAIFHSTASPPSRTAPSRPQCQVRWSDDEDIVQLIRSWFCCCSRILAAALEHAIRSEIPVRTWNHSAAARLCAVLVFQDDVDISFKSACFAVVGAAPELRICVLHKSLKGLIAA
jgi:hypothetical protein